MTISIDTSALLSYYQSRTGQTGGAGVTGNNAGSSAKAKIAPTAPWDTSSGAPRANDLVKKVLAGRKFVDVGAAQLDVPGASEDYRRLFAVFQGLNALNGLAERAAVKGISTFEAERLNTVFAKGLGEVSTFLGGLKMDQMRLTQGEAMTKASNAVGVRRDQPNYVTAPLHTGSSGAAVGAFQGPVEFDIAIRRGTTDLAVHIDLDEMGSTPRTMANVVIHLNGKMAEAGAFTRFAVERIPGKPQTVQVGGKTVTISAAVDSYALKIKGDTAEVMTLSAPATSGAVYLAQTAGKDGEEARQLVKFQTDTTTGLAAPDAYAAPGETFTAAGRVFAKPLGAEVAAVRSTAAGADGSVYVLADVTAASDGQTLKGERDVALLKYDSAGNLIYSRTLGAGDAASGMALAVAADGKVAVAGSVEGRLTGTTTPGDADETDSFLTVFDPDGDELWTRRRAAREADEATGVAFGPDGSVYVTGRAKSTMPGAAGSLGGWDSYLQAFEADGDVRFTTQFGGVGDDRVSGLVVDGSSVVVAGVEAGRGVLRRFDVSGAAPIETATRDLGDLQGGAIAGLALDGGEVIVAGSTRNAALSAGTVTAAHGGGMDAFAARLSADLGAQAGDRVAFLGGAGDSAATAITVANGEVWLAGTAAGDLPGLAAVGEKDTFVARLDIASGTSAWSRRFTAAGNTAAPTAIAVDPSGASVLDRLGLPSGVLDQSDSKLLTSATSLRAGDQFFVRTSIGGRAAAVTIEADDTLKTLAAKINRAGGFRLKATVVKDGDYDRLQIKSLNERYPVEIVAGPAGKDALESLGLPDGLVRTLGSDVEESDLQKIYGLKLDADLDLGDPASIKRATDQLMAAMSVVRAAYRDLKAASEPKTNKAALGPAPAYLTNQIANYQAALNRLNGGF